MPSPTAFALCPLFGGLLGGFQNQPLTNPCPVVRVPGPQRSLGPQGLRVITFLGFWVAAQDGLLTSSIPSPRALFSPKEATLTTCLSHQDDLSCAHYSPELVSPREASARKNLEGRSTAWLCHLPQHHASPREPQSFHLWDGHEDRYTCLTEKIPFCVCWFRLQPFQRRQGNSQSPGFLVHPSGCGNRTPGRQQEYRRTTSPPARCCLSGGLCLL